MYRVSPFTYITEGLLGQGESLHARRTLADTLTSYQRLATN
jgi:hypothetical protein